MYMYLYFVFRPSVKQVNARELEQYLAVKDVVFVYVYNEKQELPVSTVW